MNKEELKERRKKMYREAKAKRESDPQFIAMKERAREERKKAYRAHQQKIKEQKLAEKQLRQKEKDEELAKEIGLYDQLKLLTFE